MQTICHTIHAESREDTFRLYYLTDMHIGARACDENLLRSYIRHIAEDDHALWIGGGDYVDAICRKSDKRYNEETIADWLWGEVDIIGAQLRYWHEMFKPIYGKCIGLLCGNHEYAAKRYYERDIYTELVVRAAEGRDCDPLDLALGVNGFVVLRFRRRYKESRSRGYGATQTFTFYCHHGYGGGALQGGDALALERVLGNYDCDIALFGHRHRLHAVYKVVSAPGAHGRGCKQRNKIGLLCGHFLNAHINPSTRQRLTDTYAEEKGLPPSPLGAPKIEIKPDRRKVNVILPLQAAEE